MSQGLGSYTLHICPSHCLWEHSAMADSYGRQSLETQTKQAFVEACEKLAQHSLWPQ